MTTSTFTLALGAVATLAGSDQSWRPLDLGPRHPSRAGLVLIDVRTAATADLADGTAPSQEPAGMEPTQGVSHIAHTATGATGASGAIAPHDDECASAMILHARVRPGHSHRAAEKLFEVRDYRQVLMLADRHDWSASIHGELVIAAAAEELLGMPVPERARLVRLLLAEHARIASHLAFLEFVPHRMDRTDLLTRVNAARNGARDLLFALTGNRVHPMVVRLGGVACDPTPEWCMAVRAWALDCQALDGDLQLLLDDPDWLALAGGIGVLDAAAVDAHGLSGPISAASGIDRGVHRTAPRPARATGDAASRFSALCADLAASSEELVDLAQRLEASSGALETPLSKIVKVPEGEVFTDGDAPMGLAGVHLVSRSATTPWRLRLRTPTFANVQALQAALVGTPVDRADVVVASLGHTIGDLDK